MAFVSFNDHTVLLKVGPGGYLGGIGDAGNNQAVGHFEIRLSGTTLLGELADTGFGAVEVDRPGVFFFRCFGSVDGKPLVLQLFD